MNPLNKKGFTIVELVIVIAVIAILSAVLIPTFSSIIKKANQASDIQAARQMDVVLQAESAIEKPADFKAVVAILGDAGFDVEDPLMPITQDHTFYWHKTYNVILLANEEDGAAPVILYPAEHTELADSFATDKALTDDAKVLYDLAESYKYVVAKVDTAEKLATALSKGQSVTLTADVAVDGATGAVELAEGSSVTMNLGGNTLTVNGAAETFVKSYGDFTLEGGELVVNGSGYGAALTNVGSGTMTVKNVTITSNVDTTAFAVSNQSGELIMKDTTIDAKCGCLNVQGGTATVTDCTFISETGRTASYYTHTHLVQVGAYSGSTLNLEGEITVNITAPADKDIVAFIFMAGTYGSPKTYGTLSAANAYTFKTTTAGNFKGTNADNYVYYEP